VGSNPTLSASTRMNVPIKARPWLIVLAVDVAAFALFVCGLTAGVPLLTGAGVALVVATAIQRSWYWRGRAARPSRAGAS
jgi:hypothetical protein